MEIWVTIAVVVLVVTLVAVAVDRRRGPTGSSRPLDFNANNREQSQYDGRFHGPISGAGGGDGGSGP